MRRVLLYVLGALARGARLAPEDLVVVVHSGSVENATTARRLPWLPADSRHVIVGGATGDDRDFGADRRRRSLMFVNYDDNPGCARSASRESPCTDPTYERIGKYYGAHRTVAGVFVANVTWPDAAWVLVCDDDNYVDLDTVRAYLGALDAGVPLLLAGRVGPGRDSVPCRPSNNATHWSCCTDASVPCYAHVSGPQAVWDYDASRGTFAPEKVCPDHETAPYCCRTAPWPQGISRGFPYRLDGDGSYRPHFAKLWPYGGAGYALSRGLLDAIPAAHWEARGLCGIRPPVFLGYPRASHRTRFPRFLRTRRPERPSLNIRSGTLESNRISETGWDSTQACMYRLQCANADHRVMTCVLTAGFSLTRHGKPSARGAIPGILHHVHDMHAHDGSETHQKLTRQQEAAFRTAKMTPLHKSPRRPGGRG